MNTSTALHNAADHIAMFGLFKGGAFPPGSKGLDAVPLCTLGALTYGATAENAFDRAAVIRARDAFREYVGFASDTQIIAWSDDPARTAEDVVAALRAAAAIEEARETARGPIGEDPPVRVKVPVGGGRG